ncbi:hypothetical protein [Cyanobium gracile]|uniref:hypothetical protein n=1 Tax=Cyanobium gracile TaxID=59930 RepID=UPI0002F09083|nr:hypothetical protein [Cyanobium gracile]
MNDLLGQMVGWLPMRGRPQVLLQLALVALAGHGVDWWATVSGQTADQGCSNSVPPRRWPRSPWAAGWART